MVAITATNSTTPSIQASLGRARLQQARSQADQAEANARDLRAQADNAELQAGQSQDNVRKIASVIAQQEPTYAQPRESASGEVPVKVQKLIEQMYTATNDKRSKRGNPLKTDSDALPVINSQGQRTGRILNISA